jgi:hypothetical protein
MSQKVKLTAGLTAEEETHLIKLLKKVRQPWSYEFYLGFCPLACLTATETVFLRWIKGRLYVLLVKRDSNDPHFKGQVHSPGSMLRATDNKGEGLDAFKDPIARACKEVNFDPESIRLKFAGFLSHNTPRGAELAMIFACLCEGEDPVFSGNDWYLVDQLPGNIISHHLAIVKIAVQTVHE